MSSLSLALIHNQERVLKKLGSSEWQEYTESDVINANYDFTTYDGFVDKEYPLWQELNIEEHFRFIHEVDILDFGYDIDDYPDDELPKYTSGSGGRAGAGEINFKIQAIDRFACRVSFLGHLRGSSFELGLSVKFRLNVLGYSKDNWLGFAGETIAEGYAFSCMKRWKQAFFCYFSALDSIIDAKIHAHNTEALDGDKIEEVQRLADKLTILAKKSVPTHINGLNGVKIWGNFLGTFKRIVKTRDKIAHNVDHAPITEKDADDCFSTLAISVAFLHGGAFDEKNIKSYYGIE